MAFAWVDGQLVDEDRAVISIFDHGLVVGDAAFETIAVVGGQPFALSRHVARLRRTAAGLGIVEPEPGRVERAIMDVVGANGYPQAKIRVTYTGGESELGSARRGDPPHVVVAEQSVEVEPPTSRLAVAPWPRNERGAVAGLKTTSYAENVVGLRWAHERGASEVIFPNTRDEVCEGSGSNIFLVRGEEVLTPPLSSGALAGVTRDLVVEGFGVKEVPLALSQLYDPQTTEIFVTSTLRMVQGCEQIDERRFEGAPGPKTLEIQKYFAELLATEIDP